MECSCVVISLTTNPVTIDDLRKLIVDRVKSVKNVWVTNLTTNHAFKGSEFKVSNFSGLYSISVETEYITQERFEGDIKEVIKDIRRVFYEHRNMCEYLYDIQVYNPYEIGFTLDVTIKETVDGEQVLAQAINAMNAHLSQEVEFKILVGNTINIDF